VVGGVGVTGQPVGHAHGGPPRLLKLSKAQKRARPESISRNTWINQSVTRSETSLGAQD